VRAGLSEKRRRWFAGLAILIVIVVLVGQAFAAAWIIMPISNETGHVESHAHAMPAGMAQADADTPCKHRGGTHNPACCLSAHGSMLSPWLAVTAPALLPAGLIEFSYANIIPALPDRLAPAPAVPPPRHQV
jgi:hypothetical protein